MISDRVVAGMLVASVFSVSAAMVFVSRPAPAMDRETCAELAEVAGYDSEYTSDGTCWLHLDHGVTLPFPQAMDAIGFVFRAAETDKLARLQEIRIAAHGGE